MSDASSRVFGIGEYDDLFDKHLGEFKGERVDAIVLGCTHYIFIKEVLAEYAQRNFLGECRFFDGNLGTVRQLARVLKSKDMLNNQQKPTVDFYTSGDEARLKPLIN